MLSDTLKDLYLSKDSWELFLRSFFIPAYTSSQSAIVSIPGAGVMALLKYTSRNTSFFQDDLLKGDQARILLFLSLDALISNGKIARSQLLESLQIFISSHSSIFPQDLYEKTSKLKSCTEMITYLTNHLGYRIMLILSGLQDVGKLASTASHLKNIRSDKINFIYIFYNEIDTTEVSQTLRYLTNIYYFPLFNQDSVSRYISQISHIEGRELAKETCDAIFKYSGGDGTLVKVMTYKALADKKLVDVIESGTVVDVWQATGEPFLVKRFENIVTALSEESLKWLQTNKGDIPGYLYKTGVASRVGVEYSPLFKYFLQYHFDTRATNRQKMGGEKFDISLLTGKEFELYSYLLEHPGIIAKSELAHHVWSIQAGETFSLWSLDKLLSNLRKKLLLYKSEKRLVVIREKGVRLF